MLLVRCSLPYFRESFQGCGELSLQDGGDAFQGARAAAALEAIALVLALTFPDTAAVPDFRAAPCTGLCDGRVSKQ